MSNFRDKYKTDLRNDHALRLSALCNRLECSIEDLFDFGTDLRKSACITELEDMVKQLDEKDAAGVASGENNEVSLDKLYPDDELPIDEAIEDAMESGTDDPAVVQLALLRMSTEENSRLATNAMRNAGIANEAALRKHRAVLRKRPKNS